MLLNRRVEWICMWAWLMAKYLIRQHFPTQRRKETKKWTEEWWTERQKERWGRHSSWGSIS